MELQEIDNTPNYDLKTVEIDKGLLPQQVQVIEPEEEAPEASTLATIDAPISRLKGRKFREKLKFDLHYYGLRHSNDEVLSKVRYCENDGYVSIITSLRSDTGFVVRRLPVLYLLHTTAKELYVVVHMPNGTFRLGRKLSTDDEPVSVLTASELRSLTKLRIRNQDQPSIRDRIDAELNSYRNTRS
ncbi:MAG: hypothetical protein EOO17_03325 [Chloroflexi bacterium]|nr:MAG: hypothetical protein EOO17_03325 [Chloroflexota bacterium]